MKTGLYRMIPFQRVPMQKSSEGLIWCPLHADTAGSQRKARFPLNTQD